MTSYKHCPILAMEEHFVHGIWQEDIALKLKQWLMLLYTLAEDPMLTAVYARLGCSVRINSATPRHRMQVIVRLGRPLNCAISMVVSFIGS